MTSNYDKWNAYGLKVGCPPDQLRNFRYGEYGATLKGLEFHAMARLADRPDGPVQIAMGGARGGSKSHTEFAQTVFDDCMRVKGLKWLFLRKVGKAARESFEDLIDKVCPQYRGSYSAYRSTLTLPNEGRILFGGYNTESDIDNYLGIEYDGVTIEENNLLTLLKHQQIRGSIRTSKPNWRPRLYSNFNPGGVGHAYIKKLFIEPWERKQETDTRFIFATYHDNPHIDDAYRDYLESLTGWLGRAWRDGDWNIAAGQYFTTFNREIHVAKFDASQHWTWWLAMDYGFKHYTVVYLMAKDGDGNVYVWGEHAERGWLVKSHSDAIHAMVRRSPARAVHKFVAGADVFAKRGEEATIAEQYRAFNHKLEPAQMNRINGAAEILRRLGSVEQGIPPTITIHPRCARLIECLPEMQHDPRRPEDVLKVDCDEEGNGGDDFYDCARYGIMEAVEKKSTVRVTRYA